MNPDWTPTGLVATPLLGEDKRFYHNPGRHLMREAYAIDRDAIFRDFFHKLAQFATGGGQA